MAAAEQVRIPVAEGEPVRGLWLDGPRGVYAFAHGAGAGAQHTFMKGVAVRLQARGIATLRFDFPYITEGRRLPPRAHTLTGVLRAAVEYARGRAAGRPVWAGGKSMGGRVASMAEADRPLGVAGLVFLGFPLHPARRPGVERADHLSDVKVPMRFLSGTRDALARRDLLAPAVAGLGDSAELHWIESADHGFGVLVRSGRTRADVLDEISERVAAWIE